MASFVELYCDQGTSFNVTMDLKNDDGTAMNVTNYSFASSIRKSYYSANAAANITVTVTNAGSGGVTLSMNSAVTSNIKAGRYVYDVRMADAANTSVSRVIEGIITIYPQVTK